MQVSGFPLVLEFILAIHTFKENHSDFVELIGRELQAASYYLKIALLDQQLYTFFSFISLGVCALLLLTGAARDVFSCFRESVGVQVGVGL